MTAKTWRVLACLLVILFSAWIQTRVATRTVVDVPVRADAQHYVSYAWNLRTFNVFSRSPTWASEDPGAPVPDKMTLPGYPALLSLFFQDQPDMAFVQRVVFVQMMFGIATCAIVLMLAIQLLPFAGAIVVGILMAISPHLSTINTYLLTESLFTLLLAISLYMLVRAAMERRAIKWHAGAGLALALTCLVRPQLQLLPFFIAALCAALPSLRPRLPSVVLGLACFIAVMLPWHLRNTGVDQPAGEPNLLAATLYHGSFPDMMYRDDPRSYGLAYRFDPQAQAHGQDVDAALDHISAEFRAQPGRMLRWYLLGKPEFLLSWNIIAGAGDVYIYPVRASPYLSSPAFIALHRISYWLHWPLTLLALAAVLAAAVRPDSLSLDAHRRQALRMLALVLAFVILMHMIGAPYPRYGIPFRPLVYLLGVSMLWGTWRTWRHGRPLPSKTDGAATSQ